VLSSIPTTIQLPSICDYSWFDTPSPLSSLDDSDDDDLNFNSGPNDSSSAELYIIQTEFDPSLERNTKMEYKQKDDKRLHLFSERERGYAALATSCETLEDLDSMVVYFFLFIISITYFFFIA